MADPGFLSREGGTNRNGGGRRQPIIWPLFSENGMSMKKTGPLRPTPNSPIHFDPADNEADEADQEKNDATEALDHMSTL